MKRIVCGALLLLAAGCSPRREPVAVAPVRVRTVVAAASAASVARTYVGVVEEEDAAVLSFPVAGTLARIAVDEGASVREGELLAEVDPASVQRAYEAAKATLDQAEDACRRLKMLYDAGSLPEIQWVEAQTRLQQARSACEIARRNLDDCTLRAPFAGVVGRRRASVGETVLPGAPVLSLLAVGTVEVRFSVPEGEIAALRPDSPAEVCVAALGDRRFRAARLEKGVEADPAAHTYDVRAALPNAAGELLPGMVCRVEVTPAEAPEGIVLPVRAVQQAGARRFVWLVQGDSVLRRTVRTAGLAGNGIVVAEGLRDGDRVVVEGMQKIGEGTKVVWQ